MAKSRKRKWFPCFSIVLALWILFGSQSFLLARETEKEHRFNKEYLQNFGQDFVSVVKSPAGWHKKDLLALSAVLGGGIVLFASDGKIQDWFQDQKTSSSKDASHFVSHFGEGLFLSALMASLYASGEWLHKDNLRETALLSLESWLTTGVLVLGLKTIIGRARPQTGEDRTSFHPFSFRSNYQALPSGHAASAFAVAAVIGEESESLPVDVLAYSLATLVALSRVHDNKHWASDVFIGSALGYFVGKKICALNHNREEGRIHISFHLAKDKQAVFLSLQF